MKMQHLIYTIEVDNAGSISKAAENLYMAQPNLSNALKELEQEIGITIFKRIPRGIETTKEGREFINYAKDIISRFKYLEDMYCCQKQTVRTLSVTSMRSSYICMYMTEYIDRINADDVSLQVKFKEATNFDAINDVASGEADIGIIRPNSTNYEYFYNLVKTKHCELIPLPVTDYCVLMSREHPLAKEECVTSEMLAPYTEVIHGDFEIPMFPYSDMKKKAFGGGAVNKTIFVYDRGTLMEMINNVKGSYMWTSTTHPNLVERYGLVEKYCDLPHVQGRDAIVYNGMKAKTPEMEKFIEFLEMKHRDIAKL